MELLLSYLAGLILAAILICVHYAVLTAIAKLSKRQRVRHQGWIMAVMFILLVGHTVEIGIYAFAYYALEDKGLGGFTPEFGGAALDYVRFSAVSFTTLGVGPVQPTGGFGILSAMEGLAGFSLITWSATFGYSAMRKLWDQTL